MLIRKNTKAFKTILEIITSCQDRPDREELIRVYITKAGDSIRERINVQAIQGEAGLFYEMSYQAVLGNLKSSNHQLHHSDEMPGVYFFRSSSNKVWDETPFEFDEAVAKEFSRLPELPVSRKKEKAEKFVIPAPKMKAEPRPTKAPKEKTLAKKEKSPATKEQAEPKKSAKVVALWPKQPDYDLKQEIHFTGLERIVIRQAQLTKKDILDYYNKIADTLLPYLKDRPQVIRLHREGHQAPAIRTLEALKQNTAEEIPEWIKTATVKKGKEQEQLLLCNDKEHLLFYVQIGCVEFQACHFRLLAGASAKASLKSPDAPDYLIVAIESPDYELEKAINVARAAHAIFHGLKLPSFVKSDGQSGLHVYIPLDSKSGSESSKSLAEYLCKMIRLKIPDRVALKGMEHGYTKVSLDFSMNEEEKAVIAPYSLVAQTGNVAAPLLWEEVHEGLKLEGFTHGSIFKRLKQEGDPFDALLRKKANADALMERLEENYSFLL